VESSLSTLLRGDITFKLNSSSGMALGTRLCGVPTQARGDQAAGSAKQTGKELKSVEAQYQALLPECPASAGGTKDEVSFEERQGQRQAEIDSLKQALEMLAP